MKVKMLAAIVFSGILAASIANAAPAPAATDNFGDLQGPQLADNSSTNSGDASSNMNGSSNNDNSSNNMAGTPNNNMSDTPSPMGGSGSGSASPPPSSSPSDEGGADTATGDDY
ncbi:MAG TPA: hypothetical protein VLI69_04875 [Gammaproteobacteria bacterium]|nr:hypothetical protein [Gammaproteobacteria bacterium]